MQASIRMRLLKFPGRNSGSRLEGPGFLHEIDIGHWIEARAHRPQHLIEIACVDVLIHDDVHLPA
jgi:hypothetical protein